MTLWAAVNASCASVLTAMANISWNVVRARVAMSHCELLGTLAQA